MALWWLGNLILLVASAALLFVIYRILKPLNEIRKHAADIIHDTAEIRTNLQAVPKLLQTQRLAGVARQGVGAYGAAITKLL
jgi:hypothetical protein